MKTNSYNIVGSPYETERDIWATIELNRECAPDNKEFYVVGSDGVKFDKMTKYEYNAKMKFSVSCIELVKHSHLNKGTQTLVAL